MNSAHGQFIWFELMTADPAAARHFYNHVVGWQIEQTPSSVQNQDIGYRMILNGPGAVGGVFTLTAQMCSEGAKPAWMSYICVDDVDAMVARVQAAAGQVGMPAKDVAGVGRIAMVCDPQGAPFYIMRPASDGQSHAFSPGKLGHAGWSELHALEPEQACDFYCEHFGWSKGTAMDMGPEGSYQLLQKNGIDFGAVFKGQLGQAAWLTYFQVASIGAAAERIQQAGGKVINGPMQVPGDDWIVNGMDPEGVFFALVGKQ